MKAAKTGSASAGRGGVANTGIINGDIYVGVPVRTRYLEQVRRVVPRDFRGRDAELAELAEFCLASEPHQSYRWWTGEAWAGKSALLSQFVLDPPVDVRVVSFFITGRFAGHDNRVGFIDNVLEQLATLLGEPLPPFLNELTKEAHLLGMLSDAAQACRDRGERLVLVVDGLDEDTGVVPGCRPHSVAALLPDPPPAGMRIIVSGRPNPAVPTDVPDGHRLHDRSIIRPLSASPHAAVAHEDMRADLMRLLKGGEIGRDMLGLLTAARGGLSQMDLIALTGAQAWQVDEVLGTVTGRCFSPRPSRWDGGSVPDVYVLAHEDLQNNAEMYFGDEELGAYRERLHAWADGYCEQGWPEETPEYLLGGYAGMLLHSHDVRRLMCLAADRARHDRTLAMTGSDADAMAEIEAAFHVAAALPEPDLAVVARMAYHRDWLEDRNARLPAELPVGWARIGQYRRAEALARSIAGAVPRARCLAAIGEVCARAGLESEADRLLDEAGQLASAGSSQGWELASEAIVAGLARRGHLARARELAGKITGSTARARAVASVSVALARAGQFAGTEGLAAEISDPAAQALAFAEVAGGLVLSGLSGQALQVAGETELLVNAAMPTQQQYPVISAAARAYARAGEPGHAERLANKLAEPDARAAALADVAAVIAESGDHTQAIRLAADAEKLLNEAAQATESHPLWYRSHTVCGLARTQAAAGQASTARALAMTLSQPDDQVACLIGVAGTLAATGETRRAARVLAEAEAIVREAADPTAAADALVSVAWMAINSGNTGLAVELLSDLETAVTVTPDPEVTGLRPRSVADALAAAGESDRAVSIATGISDRKARDGALADVARALAHRGHPGQGLAVAKTISNRRWRSWALRVIAETMAEEGQIEKAADLASALPDLDDRSYALAKIAAKAAEAGQREKALAISEAIPDAKHSIGVPGVAAGLGRAASSATRSI